MTDVLKEENQRRELACRLQRARDIDGGGGRRGGGRGEGGREGDKQTEKDWTGKCKRLRSS